MPQESGGSELERLGARATSGLVFFFGSPRRMEGFFFFRCAAVAGVLSVFLVGVVALYPF